MSSDTDMLEASLEAREVAPTAEEFSQEFSDPTDRSGLAAHLADNEIQPGSVDTVDPGQAIAEGVQSEPETSEGIQQVNSAPSGDEANTVSPPKLDPQLLMTASAHGLSVADVNSLIQMGGEQAVHATIQGVRHRMMQSQQAPQNQQGAVQAPQQQQPPSLIEPFEIEDPDAYDEVTLGLVNHFNQQMLKMQGIIQQQQQQAAMMHQHLQHQQQREARQNFESRLSSLPENFKSLVGDGANRTPEQFNLINQLWQDQAMRANWLAQQGYQVDENAVWNQTVNSVLGGALQQQTAQTQKHRRMQVARPTSSSQVDLRDEDASAAEAVRDVLERHSLR